VLAVLRDKGANLNKCAGQWGSPAYRAAMEGQVGALELLRDAGADLAAPNTNGTTPAFAAAQDGHAAVLRFLVASKVSLFFNS
jgi:ankyrin repeat protein